MYPQSYSHHHLDGHVPDNEIRPGVSSAPHPSYDRVRVHGIPARNGHRHAGNSQSDFIRSYSPLKIIGDGLFGTVWLCDWHRALPPNTPMPAMQCGAGARPEYANKRLVAVKRIKKRWGGWDECERLKELQALRAIPAHSNVIPLYDCFFLPSTKELYLVFEPMEGNLWQLIKVRKGKPFAGGLVSSIFKQVASGLHHIHAAGYFHRDLKPENLLVTTTGKRDYRPVYDHAPPDASSEHDVIVIVKLADFGLARKIQSAPPYTEYVSTRWYRAPEVILKSREYSAAVDMWGFGVIMAEVLTLRPLLPGNGEIDQLAKICDLLGDPMDDHGVDPRGATVGGGKWPAGVAMAKSVGFAFQKNKPKNISELFDPTVPAKLIDCIADLLKYNPELRLNSWQCLEHSYLRETTSLDPPIPQLQSPAMTMYPHPTTHFIPAPYKDLEKTGDEESPLLRSTPTHYMSSTLTPRPSKVDAQSYFLLVLIRVGQVLLSSCLLIIILAVYYYYISGGYGEPKY